MRTLTFLKSRRLWVVRDILVWGSVGSAEFFYLGVESVDSADRIMFGVSRLGGTAQDVLFSDLTDYKGNNLPSSIDSPRVLIRPRSAYLAYLVGEESNNGFRVARDPAAPGPVNVDYFIYEMGSQQ
jgi:hypothetical protein